MSYLFVSEMAAHSDKENNSKLPAQLINLRKCVEMMIEEWGTSHSEEIINNASAMLEIVILPANRDTNVLKVGISRPLSTPPEDLSNIASGVANSVTAASEQEHPTSLCQVKTDINLIALRKEKLRLQNLCNVCRDEKANRLFLPCSHVSACASCLPSLTHCPRCLFLIRGIVSVYFS